MTKITGDFIKFIAEVISLLMIFSIIFDPARGIITNTYFYLTYAEPITLLNHISTAMTTAGYVPGEFSTSFKTSGLPYVIDIYKEGKETYASLNLSLVRQEAFNTEFVGINPVPIVSDCYIPDQTLVLTEGLIQEITIKKIIEDGSCEVFIVTADIPYGFDVYVSPDSGIMVAGDEIETTVTVSSTETIAPEAVVLSTSGEPSGAKISFSRNSIEPTYSSEMTIYTDTTIPVGVYKIKIKGTSGRLIRTVTYELEILPTCFCTDWKDEGCGIGTCEANEMNKTRVCNPAGCKKESQCVSDPSCMAIPTEIEDFEDYWYWTTSKVGNPNNGFDRDWSTFSEYQERFAILEWLNVNYSVPFDITSAKIEYKINPEIGTNNFIAMSCYNYDITSWTANLVFKSNQNNDFHENVSIPLVCLNGELKTRWGFKSDVINYPRFYEQKIWWRFE